MRQPTTNTLTAAKNAQKRLLTELDGEKGADATRQRRAVNSIYNTVDRYVDGALARKIKHPDSVETNPQSPIERKVAKYWKAVEHLMDWMFNRDTILKERDVIAAFDAIV